jgi:hypothetical protein
MRKEEGDNQVHTLQVVIEVDFLLVVHQALFRQVVEEVVEEVNFNYFYKKFGLILYLYI